MTNGGHRGPSPRDGGPSPRDDAPHRGTTPLTPGRRPSPRDGGPSPRDGGSHQATAALTVRWADPHDTRRGRAWAGASRAGSHGAASRTGKDPQENKRCRGSGMAQTAWAGRASGDGAGAGSGGSSGITGSTMSK
ncbi:hypothetical protein Aoc01nite_17890 [Actinoplanes octamycinicus]|nr:hypothetical protein Aoc01nite_17890 [Actinoplanes octamycinicus]